MNAQELARRLLEEGCAPSMFAIGARGVASDAFCLSHDGEAWRVYYTERGRDAPPIFRSRDEAAACEFFFRHLTALRPDHLVGFFREQRDAEALRDRLQAAGIAAWRDCVPYGRDDPRHRVFVPGKAVFEARAVLGELPARDAAG